MSERLVFLHISDLHLCESVHGQPTDLDADVRTVFLDDVVNVLSGRRVDRVLVTGDLAFAGKEAEFVFAREFLNCVCDMVGAGRQDVRVVPGNHDVDRGLIAKSAFGSMARESLRTTPLLEIDPTLKELVQDRLDPLLDSLGAYREFAAAYGCEITKEQWWWDDSELDLSGVRVLLRGISTALVSDEGDDDQAENTKLVVGRHQLTGHTPEKGLGVLLGHHPPSWWRDASVLKAYTGRWQLQLYGHEHTFKGDHINGSLALVADALHPPDGSDWSPGYSVIELSREQSDQDEYVEVVVAAQTRVWFPEEARFGPRVDTEGNEVVFKQYEFKGELEVASAAAPSSEQVVGPAAPTVSPSTSLAEYRRELIFEFRTGLTRATQLDILSDLGLLEDHEWSEVSGTELITRALSRADERGQLGDVWGRALARGAQLNDENPFA